MGKPRIEKGMWKIKLKDRHKLKCRESIGNTCNYVSVWESADVTDANIRANRVPATKGPQVSIRLEIPCNGHHKLATHLIYKIRNWNL